MKERNLKAVCIDIDGTVAFNSLGYAEIGYFEYVLAGLLCCKERLLPSEAMNMVLETELKYPGNDPFAAAVELGILLEEYRREIAVVQEKYLHIFDDVRKLIIYLKERNYLLFVTSNNSMSRSLAVLTTAGLADWETSRYFSRVFSPQSTGFNKRQTGFYEKVIEESSLGTDDIIMLGDDAYCDREVPANAGIGMSIIVNREHNNKKDEVDLISIFKETIKN